MEQLSFTEVGDILGLIGRLDCDTFEMEYGELKISVDRTGSAQLPHTPHRSVPLLDTPPQGSAPEPLVEPPRPPQQDSPAAPNEEPGTTAVVVAAPMTGTFYRSPAPGEPPCAGVGDEVAAGQTVALIEVMKLFTELKAETAGTVVRIDAEDSSLVEYGQPLMWIEPQ